MIMAIRLSLSVLVGILVAAMLGVAAPATAQSAEEFFKGKTLTYIVATAPGGGYDTYARLIAGHMEKYLPVKNISVKNVPGAGHIIGANQLHASKPDGLTIGTFNTGLVYAQLVERKGIKFDLGNFTYLGKSAADPRTIMVSTQSGIESFDQLVGSERQVKFAGAGPGSGRRKRTSWSRKKTRCLNPCRPSFQSTSRHSCTSRFSVVRRT
jgi:tripartite-type tricarboxylate transporter receptor subunit TctC